MAPEALAATRALFDPDPNLIYLDTATYGLPPRPTVAALRAALDGWQRGSADWVREWDTRGEDCRMAFASLIERTRDEIALIPSASVGVGTIAANLTADDEVVIPDDEFNSVLFPILVAQRARGTTVRQVPFSLLAEGVRPTTTLVAFSLVQSQSGRTANQRHIVDAARGVGARTLVDATHAVPFITPDPRADFVVCSAYKHLLSPRGVAFLTVERECWETTPAWLANWRSTPDPYASYYGGPLSQAETAARYDVSLAWHAWAGAAVSLGLLEQWQQQGLLQTPLELARRLARNLGLAEPTSTLVSVPVENAEAVRAELQSAGIKAAVRAGSVRLSTHVYTTDQQVDRAADALALLYPAVGSAMSLIERLRDALGRDSVFAAVEDTIMYEYDYGLDRAMPDIVALPRSTADVQVLVREAQAAGVPIVARGAGTGISGGAVPVRGGLVISMARMNRVLEIDQANRCAVVQPGAVNLDLSKLTEPFGLFFAPDPSSQKASTIGGNIANNAGGPHCLSLGCTVNHILGVEVVLHDGSALRLGGKTSGGIGFDLTGVMVGSEGTLAVVTEATVRLMPLPEAVQTTLAIFPSVEAASEAVSDLIAHGIVPSALEMMDRLALSAIEAAFHAGYPPEAGAVLLVEVDGLLEQVEAQANVVDEVCRRAGAMEIRLAASDEDRARLWAARKGAASAMGRIAPNYYLHDAVVPRTRLPAILAQVVEIGRRYDLPIANLFHAGDGNLHPMILFDVREPGILDRVMDAGREILGRCIEAGGTITGEHGVGMEKRAYMPLIFSADDLEVMGRVRSAIDPSGRFNPGKVLPSSGELPSVAVGAHARIPEGMWV